MTISNRTIRLVSTARDMSGHGCPVSLSDIDYMWIEPGDSNYGLGFDGFTVYAVRDADYEQDECYAINVCDMGDVENLRDEAEAAGDTDMHERCVEALDGDMDALLICVEAIMDAMLRSLDD